MAGLADSALSAHLHSFFDGHEMARQPWDELPMPRRLPGFAVYVIEPGPRFAGWTYVSSGCWQATQHGGHGIEFVLSARDDDPRHAELVAVNAFYHAGPLSQRLDLGHTATIGEPWVAGSACTHLLVGLPYAYGPELEHCRIGDAGSADHIRILALQPITEAERDFKAEHGAVALEQRLEDNSVAFSDPLRPCVIRPASP